jgi:Bacterial protein of unknown function (DUF885)
MPRPVLLPLTLALLAGLASAAPVAPRIASIAIPGDARFVAIARDVLLVQTEETPDFAAQSGLIDDAIRVPSFAPARLAALTRRLRADMAGLRALPWRTWSVDQQIDVRWVYANAERIDRELNAERLYLHRPGAWLESVANDLIAIVTYAPARTDAVDGIAAQVPALVAEMTSICQPTGVDADVAQGVIDGIVAVLKMAPGAHREAAIAALNDYRQRLATVKDRTTFTVVGTANYAWRLRHASLLPWTPDALLALAQQRLKTVDAEIATLVPQLPKPAPLSPELEAQARSLDQASLLALYDHIQVDYRAAIEKAGFVTIPAGVGPVRARVTPDAMVPLDGDGGSMNPPPPFIADDTGWWNVEHFDPKMSLAGREDDIREGVLYRLNGMGPYAAHEGVPGHHLQLSIARLNPDPVRNLFQDPVQNEGWALYAEQEMWEQGGLGDTIQAHHAMLKGWRSRIRRVVYDVDMETGTWTLQQAADWRAQTAPGKTPVSPEILRAINWPAQLICYFAGKEQILALKRDYRARLGAAYSERRFNDELLALGSVPYVFARAKMLDEPVPDFDVPS